MCTVDSGPELSHLGTKYIGRGIYVGERFSYLLQATPMCCGMGMTWIDIYSYNISLLSCLFMSTFHIINILLRIIIHTSKQMSQGWCPRVYRV